MLTERISYPHPVLGLSDDIDGDFNVEINVERNKEQKTVRFNASNISITNTYFLNLIENENAKLILKIYCSSTFKTWVMRNINEPFEIPEDELCNKVEVEPLIIAATDIENYYDESFNLEFDNYRFAVKKYEVIGVLGKLIIPIDKNYEKLSLGNIFEFSPEDDETIPCSFQFITDKIVVKYPVTVNGDDPPNGLFHKSPWAAYNMIIIPALTEAFRIMDDKEKSSAFEDKDWYFVLEMLLPREERDRDEPFKSAQLLLNRQIPLLNAYDELCLN